MPGRLVILGAGGHGRAVADLAVACDWTVAGFTDPGAGPGTPMVGVIGQDTDLPTFVRERVVDGGVVGVGALDLRLRAELFRRLDESGMFIASLIHPRAILSPGTVVGRGVVVFAGSILGASVSVGDNAVVYSGAIAEHGCQIADHAYLSPGVILSGAVRVERYVVAVDAGRALNPTLVEGQLVGGAVQGISGALREELVFDVEGQLLTGTLMDYSLPAAGDIGPVEALIFESHTPSNPLGAKGVGEGGISGSGAAVANAVADALRPLGARITELPLTPERVRRAIECAAGNGNGGQT